MRPRGAREEERRREVHREHLWAGRSVRRRAEGPSRAREPERRAHLVPGLVGKLDRGRAPLDARGMHKHMDARAARVALEGGERVGEERIDLRAVGELGVDDGRGAAARADRVDGRRVRVGAAEDEDEVRARLGERERDGGADACVRAARQVCLYLFDCLCLFADSQRNTDTDADTDLEMRL